MEKVICNKAEECNNGEYKCDEAQPHKRDKVCDRLCKIEGARCVALPPVTPPTVVEKIKELLTKYRKYPIDEQWDSDDLVQEIHDLYGKLMG